MQCLYSTKFICSQNQVLFVLVWNHLRTTGACARELGRQKRKVKASKSLTNKETEAPSSLIPSHLPCTPLKFPYSALSDHNYGKEPIFPPTEPSTPSTCITCGQVIQNINCHCSALLPPTLQEGMSWPGSKIGQFK